RQVRHSFPTRRSSDLTISANAVTRKRPIVFNSGKTTYSLAVTHNAEVTGAEAQRREPKAVSFWRPVDRLVSGRSPPRSPLAPSAACPLPNSLHQPDGWRKEPERKPNQPDYCLNWTALRLGHAMNNYAAGDFGNQPRQPLFRPWPSPTQAALQPSPMPRPLH